MNSKKNDSVQYKLDNNVLTITLEDNTKIDANILFTFEENGDQFIVYEIEDEINGEIQSIAYAAKINDDNSIIPIEEDEWPIVEKIFNEWQEDNEGN